jgi:glycosyltransferase involved in cell wall biosynthesis
VTSTAKGGPLGFATDGASRRVAYMVGLFPSLTETFVLREIRALRRRGVEIIVCAVRRPTLAEYGLGLPASDRDSAVVYARPDSVVRHALANLLCLVRSPRRYLTGLRTFMRAAAGLPPREALRLLFHFYAGVGFDRDLRRMGATHLHCHFTSATNMALAASLVRDRPFSFTAHASNDLFVAPMLLSEKVTRARFVVAVCEYSRLFLDSVTGYRFGPKLHRIYNGIERRDCAGHEVSAATHGRDPAASGTPRIVSVGSLVPPKGHATLIQACARLQDRGRRFRCRIVGEGPERATLERLIRVHGLEECVELVGARSLDEVYAELEGADIFALLAEIGASGYRDGFPTVILEAMAMGRPVLATSLSGIPELVVDGVTGVLVRERDVAGASEALDCLLASGDRRRVMGLAGRARVRELFDLDRSADALAALLREARQAGAAHTAA